jgi:glycosyltransferase involved in cell wall biosynthesis
MKICLVCEEFVGVTGGGGIGACFSGLSRELARQGHEVDVLITCPPPAVADLRSQIRALQFEGIDVSFLDHYEDPEIASGTPKDNIVKSYRCFRYISSRKYDVIHFHEYMGVGFYTAMSKRQGLITPLIITQTHGSSEWVRRHNLHLPDLPSLETEALERSQMELSDIVVSPSRYMLDWYRDNGVTLPERTQVLNWILPDWVDRYSGHERLGTRGLAAGKLREIIFFGRHERRKGFELFVEALRRLPPEPQLDVCFLGRFDRIDCENSVGYAFRKLRHFPGRLRFLNDYQQSRAHRYIASHQDALCVMPSLIENSPCTVGEVLSLGVPFIASDVGGTAELIEHEDRTTALFAPDPATLSLRLREIAEHGLPPVKSILWPAQIRTNWQEFHDNLPQAPQAQKKPAERPLVSVCVVHYNRPNLLLRAIEHLFQQTYSNIEIVVVDDGSTSKRAKTVLDELEARHGGERFKIIRSPNRYLGAARNLAARAARGEYLIFHDDDNVAEPRQVEIFVRAAQTSGFDILTAQCYVFKDTEPPELGKIEYFPIGIGGAFSFFCNRFGDANALIARAAFERVGGFSELHGVGWEDWEFFLKAHIKGVRIGVVPIPLFRYSVSAEGMLATGSLARNNARIFDAMRDVKPLLSADLLQVARRDQVGKEILDRTWHVLGREHFGDLHQKLMAVDPNGEEAKAKLSDLAFYLGRIDDAVELGLTTRSLRDQMHKLLTASRLAGRSSPLLGCEPCTLTSGRQRAFEIEGWITTTDMNQVQLKCIEYNSRKLKIEKYEVIERPDVAAHFGHDKIPSVGFRVFVAEDTAAASSSGNKGSEAGFKSSDKVSAVHRHFGRLPLLNRVFAGDSAVASSSGKDASEFVFTCSDGAMRLIVDGHYPQKLLGWVDKVSGVYRYFVRLPLLDNGRFTGRFEFAFDRELRDGWMVFDNERCSLVPLGNCRYEAYSMALNGLRPSAEEAGVIVYSKSDFSPVEAQAFRWTS